jgi:hypothetical protein
LYSFIIFVVSCLNFKYYHRKKKDEDKEEQEEEEEEEEKEEEQNRRKQKLNHCRGPRQKRMPSTLLHVLFFFWRSQVLVFTQVKHFVAVPLKKESLDAFVGRAFYIKHR